MSQTGSWSRSGSHGSGADFFKSSGAESDMKKVRAPTSWSQMTNRHGAKKISVHQKTL